MDPKIPDSTSATDASGFLAMLLVKRIDYVMRSVPKHRCTATSNVLRQP